ncbi:poly-gamma-glutamate biosynthesis protein PgsC/CapC [Cloacibacillus evryensis]|uniref:Poly-gamma-glutamate biosynthesis protein PgsC/CapC n=1 Tax=Cloacibacillus evryensis TaxID=508460 RepID=A0AAW5K3R7_9BACT|nr:poly-gamma-glutamate biosynthesis protein PgsC/CapC [Cloacibacillus evryensis]EHL67244.1 poly-gamma-glutamate biosynthesis protein PgsC [Synergistes sp. 3_1_syn1]MCQ4815067.1 poly-gamma-glutamate biosynthesis protein PgsC/CapC [Cloacibacillus evryensis]
MAYNVTLTLAIGIAIAMLYEARVGCSCGGLITPGAVALAMRDPERIAAGILIALAVWALLRLCERGFGLCGRRRTGTAMLLALAARASMGQISPDPLWLGWVVPGLIASDMRRSGIPETLLSLTIVSTATASAAELAVFLLSWCGVR